jgi:hypothetical protein
MDNKIVNTNINNIGVNSGNIPKSKVKCNKPDEQIEKDVFTRNLSPDQNEVELIKLRVFAVDALVDGGKTITVQAPKNRFGNNLSNDEVVISADKLAEPDSEGNYLFEPQCTGNGSPLEYVHFLQVSALYHYHHTMDVLSHYLGHPIKTQGKFKINPLSSYSTYRGEANKIRLGSYEKKDIGTIYGEATDADTVAHESSHKVHDDLIAEIRERKEAANEPFEYNRFVPFQESLADIGAMLVKMDFDHNLYKTMEETGGNLRINNRISMSGRRTFGFYMHHEYLDSFDTSKLMFLLDIKDCNNFFSNITIDERPESQHIWNSLDNEGREIIEQSVGKSISGNGKYKIFNKKMIDLMQKKDLYAPEVFEKIELPDKAKELYAKGVDNLNSEELYIFNHLLLESVYPQDIKPYYMPYKRNALDFRKRDTSISSADEHSSKIIDDHDYSKIFTGAFYDSLTNLFDRFVSETKENNKKDKLSNDENVEALKKSRDIMGKVFMRGVEKTETMNSSFQVVALRMLEVENDLYKGAYRNEMVKSFIDHGILTEEDVKKFEESHKSSDVSKSSKPTDGNLLNAALAPLIEDGRKLESNARTTQTALVSFNATTQALAVTTPSPIVALTAMSQL